MLRDRLKGKGKFETLENYSILFIVIGALMLSGGIGLTVISPKGISTVLMMLGSFISFIFTANMIYTWILKELLKDIVKEQPWGVIIISFLGFIGSAIALFQGLSSFILFSQMLLQGLLNFSALVFGFMYMGTGIFLLAVYYHFLLMKKWTWFILAILGLVSIPLNLFFMPFPWSLVILGLSPLFLIYLWLKRTLFK